MYGDIPLVYENIAREVLEEDAVDFMAARGWLLCMGFEVVRVKRLDTVRAFELCARTSFLAARCLIYVILSWLKTCCTKFARSDGTSGWTYSGDISMLASMLSLSFEGAAHTVYGCEALAASPLKWKGLISACCSLSRIEFLKASVCSGDSVSDFAIRGMTFVSAARR